MIDSFEANREAWSLLSTALDPRDPPASARERLLSEISGPARYAPFAPAIARHFDLDGVASRALLARVPDPTAWTAGVEPILGFMHFKPGPRLGRAHCGLVRMKSGMRVPAHRHRDRELSYVLEGLLFDDEGHEYGPGGVIDMPAGSIHVLHVAREADALVAVAQARTDFLGI
ncbi:MAG TPA: cupin domain-containing protein [Polyangiaceae bacterium]|nr:cupin domain-containing protein [Polyangiaceae bacterium]